MGDYNRNSPVVVGMETRYARSREISLATPQDAIAMRIRPGAVTVNAFHHFLRSVAGTPGLAIELVTDLDPAVSTTIFNPGADTLAETTGWEDQANGALNFGDIDDRFSVATHARNSTALAASSWRSMLFRGNDAGALAGQRILSVGLRVKSRLINLPTATPTVHHFGTLRINAADYVIGSYSFGKGNNFIEVPIGATPFNPETALPWTVAEVDDLIDAADADMFGVQVGTNAAAEGYNLSWYGLEVVHCTENRRARYYDSSRPRVGWTEVTPTDSAVSPANTWEWLVISCPRAGGSSSALVSLVNAPEVVEALTAAGVGEHRECARLQLTHPAGVASSVVELPGEHLAVLLQSSAPAIIGQSQSYARVEEVAIHSAVTANIGQQITTAAATNYTAAKLPVGWVDKNRRPDRPLTVEINDDINNVGAPMATGTLEPGALPDGTVREVQIPFDTPFLSVLNTQYFVFLSSEAASDRGWAIARADTRSDLIGTATTVAEIEDASQGGQTDSYVAGGTAFDRYDLPASLIATPDAPANFTATPFVDELDEDGISRYPALVELEWDATALGADFGGYRVWRRPRRTPATDWTLIGDIAPGDDPTIVEAQETAFVDEMAGWGVLGARYADGWDYAVTVLDQLTGLESDRSTTADVANIVDVAHSTWLTSNAARWLSTPLFVESGPVGSPFENTELFEKLAGRDGSAARALGGVPGMVYGLKWRWPDTYDEDVLRGARAAAVAGQEMALLRCRGDLAYGVPKYAGVDGSGVTLDADAEFVTTSRHPEPAGYNLPSGLVLDGATQWVTVADHADLDPGADDWTFFLYATLPAAAASDTFLAKRVAGDGYQIGYSAGSVLTAILDGASAAATLTDPTWVADGRPHLWMVSTDGGAQEFYRDETLVDSDTVAHGSIANSELLVAGALSDTTQPTALAPLHTWGAYRRVLTLAERRALRRYLAGWFAYRAPAGAEIFHDARDDRAWPGTGTTLRDLSGKGHHGTIVATPARRGTPVPLVDLERANLNA